MAKPRVTATDRLSNVIEVVELGQRTGLLTVERGSGSVLEEGEIYFVSGRAVYASLAGLRGREALAGLSRWGACRFAFDTDAARPSSNLMPPSGALRGPAGSPPPTPSAPYGPGASRPGSSGRLPEGSGTWNVQPDGASGFNGFNGATSQGGYAAPYTAYNGAASPGQPPAQGYPPATPGYAPGYGPVPGMRDPAARPMMPPQPALGTHPLNAAQGFLARRPRRAPDVRDLMTVVSTHNLSRGHRTLLLLADGEHNVLDLARLSSKSVDEVTTLLNELEMRGLIYYYA